VVAYARVPCALEQTMVYAYVPNFVSIALFCRSLAVKNHNFCRFFGLRQFVVSPIGGSLRKGAQLQAFPYLTASKLFLYFNAFMAKSSIQSLTFKSVTNEQTDRQIKKLNIFGRSGGG